MNVREIDTRQKNDVRKFIKLPFQLYEDCDFWVPPMMSDMKLALNPKKHPFYQHSEASFFIVEDGKEVLGRIAVLNNQPYNLSHKTSTAFFYYLDAVDEIEVFQALFEAAFDWARKQGLKKITGPLGFHALDGRGILVHGFDSMPATGIPYNHFYYGVAFEELGFKKVTDFVSGTIELKGRDLPQRLYKINDIGERRSFRIKSFTTKEDILGWVSIIRGIYNETYPSLKDHYPINEAEMNFAVDRLIEIADPKLIKLIMKEDEPIGFLLAYPNIVKGIKRSKGTLLPFGWLYLLRELKSTRRIDFNGIAILPKHQGLGASAVLYMELKKTLENLRFRRGEIVQIEDDNLKSLGEIEAIGDVEWRKRHRIYEKDLL